MTLIQLISNTYFNVALTFFILYIIYLFISYFISSKSLSFYFLFFIYLKCFFSPFFYHLRLWSIPGGLKILAQPPNSRFISATLSFNEAFPWIESSLYCHLKSGLLFGFLDPFFETNFKWLFIFITTFVGVISIYQLISFALALKPALVTKELHLELPYKLQQEIEHKKISLYLSNKKDISPCAIGFFSKKIILPNNYLKYTPEELNCILAHEIAHHSFLDPYYHLLILLTKALFWFLPIKKIKLLREQIADEAIFKYGFSSLNLASALHKTLSTPSYKRSFKSQGQTYQRVYSSLHPNQKSSSIAQGFAILFLGIFTLFAISLKVGFF
jgi:hypothetical protein